MAGLFSAILAGCGAGYRPVITPTNPTGPASQPASYAAVISTTGASSPGVITLIDYSGDTIVAQANTVGLGPLSFTVDGTGNNGYTFNSDGTVNDFPTTTTLQQKYVYYTTVAPNSAPFGFMAPSAALWATDLNANATDVFAGSSPAVFVQAIPVGATPGHGCRPGLCSCADLYDHPGRWRWPDKPVITRQPPDRRHGVWGSGLEQRDHKHDSAGQVPGLRGAVAGWSARICAEPRRRHDYCHQQPVQRAGRVHAVPE